MWCDRTKNTIATSIVKRGSNHCIKDNSAYCIPLMWQCVLSIGKRRKMYHITYTYLTRVVYRTGKMNTCRGICIIFIIFFEEHRCFSGCLIVWNSSYCPQQPAAILHAPQIPLTTEGNGGTDQVSLWVHSFTVKGPRKWRNLVYSSITWRKIISSFDHVYHLNVDFSTQVQNSHLLCFWVVLNLSGELSGGILEKEMNVTMWK